jgi:hypothetical protein
MATSRSVLEFESGGDVMTYTEASSAFATG